MLNAERILGDVVFPELTGVVEQHARDEQVAVKPLVHPGQRAGSTHHLGGMLD